MGSPGSTVAPSSEATTTARVPGMRVRCAKASLTGWASPKQPNTQTVSATIPDEPTNRNLRFRVARAWRNGEYEALPFEGRVAGRR